MSAAENKGGSSSNQESQSETQGASKMMTIFSVLVFVLVQGRAVCDEVYPISLLEGFFVNQSEWHARDHTEPPQVKSKRLRSPEFSQINCFGSISEADAVDWITKCIADEYNFEANEAEDEWIRQPDFKDVLGTQEFTSKAAQVQTFFQAFNDWDDTKRIFYKTRLLMITAARYLLVTNILYTESSGKLTPCLKSQKGNYLIPRNGVCYPVPYGSTSYKSDYDVGLIGMYSGFLTERFNDYFQKNFKKPSEFVFDTNVYAFTLEFTIPSIFVNLPLKFQPEVTDHEKTDNFKIQELVSAYFKVFKYNEKFFEDLLAKARATISVDPQKKLLMVKWINKYQGMEMSLTSFNNNPQELRKVHNKKYGEIVKSMSQENPTPYQPQFLGRLSKALIYAAEAYHTRGAIRHVVGAIQMKRIDESSRTSLSTNDLWVSMIENWGEANKEYNHCGDRPIEECFLLMSKYMWRVLDAMRLLQERLPESYTEMVRFSPCIDPECIMKMWLRYKKEGKTDFSANDKENVRLFLKEFGCKEADVIRGEFTLNCLEKIHDKVCHYNKILAHLFVLPSKLLRK